MRGNNCVCVQGGWWDELSLAQGRGGRLFGDSEAET